MNAISSNRTKKRIFIACCLAPSLFIYIWLIIYPCIRAFAMSLYEWNGYSANMTFVGLGNFIRVFNDEVFYKSLANNVYILFWCTLWTFVLSMLFAVIITSKKYRDRNILRVIFFIPYALSVTIVSVIWMFIYNPSFGALNSMLDAIGLSSLTQRWLGDSNVIMGALTVPLVWVNVGFYMVLFITSIMSIPRDRYEAAEIDGAGELQKFFFITIPGIWEMIRIALIFFIVTAFSYSFELVFVITKGGPNRASELVTTYLYEKAFRTGEFGYASALGVVLFAIVFILIFILRRTTRREDT